MCKAHVLASYFKSSAIPIESLGPLFGTLLNFQDVSIVATLMKIMFREEEEKRLVRPVEVWGRRELGRFDEKSREKHDASNWAATTHPAALHAPYEHTRDRWKG